MADLPVCLRAGACGDYVPKLKSVRLKSSEEEEETDVPLFGHGSHRRPRRTRTRARRGRKGTGVLDSEPRFVLGEKRPSVSERAYEENVEYEAEGEERREDRRDDDEASDEDEDSSRLGSADLKRVYGILLSIERDESLPSSIAPQIREAIRLVRAAGEDPGLQTKSRALSVAVDAVRTWQLARLAHDKESWLQVVSKAARPAAGPARTRRHENLEAVAADAELWSKIVKRR